LVRKKWEQSNVALLLDLNIDLIEKEQFLVIHKKEQDINVKGEFIKRFVSAVMFL